VGAIFIYPSSDYVFDGTSPPYRPSSATGPISQYGKSKLEGEQAVLRAYPDAIVVRFVFFVTGADQIPHSVMCVSVPLLYGDVAYLEESAATVLFKSVLSGVACKIDDWQVRYPTHTADVAAAFRQIVRKRQEVRPLQRCVFLNIVCD
jgi:dTDP-4-dehydrorhamnose reductase